MGHKKDCDDTAVLERARGYEEVAEELAKLDAELAQYRKDYAKWAAREEQANNDPNIPEHMRKSAIRIAARKLGLIQSGEKYRAYLVVELDQLRIRERKPYDVN